MPHIEQLQIFQLRAQVFGYNSERTIKSYQVNDVIQSQRQLIDRTGYV